MLIDSFVKLKDYCEHQNFMGWDPYDGLNSRIFNALPLKKSALCRLVFIQSFKRSPINFRRLFLVPKEHNAKGIALFLQGYCNLYKLILTNPDLEKEIGTKEYILNRINKLSEILISLQSKGYRGACWGYNFDWQARRLFLFPKNTPTVVATSFCVAALFDAYDITKKEDYLKTAVSSADYVIYDLKRTACEKGFIFSYSPLNGNDTVINASLLGSKILSRCYYYTKKELYQDLAKKSIIACCNIQKKDGSWIYGMHPVQNWIDSFHTGYNLDALIAYQENTGDYSFMRNIELGFEFYIQHFFCENGMPKYYHDKIYPIDIHCPGQLFVTISRLHKFIEHKEMMEKVFNWTIKHMQNSKGYFYYQVKKGINSKISYMRWSNAFMFNALTYYLLEENHVR